MNVEPENIALSEDDLRAVNQQLLQAARDRLSGPFSYFSPMRRICFVAALEDGVMQKWLLVPAESKERGVAVAVVLAAVFNDATRMAFERFSTQIAQSEIARIRRGPRRPWP